MMKWWQRPTNVLLQWLHKLHSHIYRRLRCEVIYLRACIVSKVKVRIAEKTRIVQCCAVGQRLMEKAANGVDL
jgi:hypothetical protein